MVLSRHLERVRREDSKRPATRERDSRAIPEILELKFVAMCAILEPVLTEELTRAATHLHTDFL
jgi:hypothetical protein